jgi:hypothetical protein
MTEYWMTKSQDDSGLILKSDFNNLLTNTSLAATVTSLQQQVASLTTQISQLNSQIVNQSPVFVNLSPVSATLTSSQFFNSFIVCNTQAFQFINLTLPSAASLIAYDPNATAGKGYYITIVDNGVNAEGSVQLFAGTGITFVGGTLIIPINSVRFFVYYNNVTSGQEAITIYRLS